MKTIQIAIDEPLPAEVDQAAQDRGTTRPAFIRAALRLALRQHAIEEMERNHEEGYGRYPVKPGEFAVRESEQM